MTVLYNLNCLFYISVYINISVNSIATLALALNKDYLFMAEIHIHIHIQIHNLFVVFLLQFSIFILLDQCINKWIENYISMNSKAYICIGIHINIDIIALVIIVIIHYVLVITELTITVLALALTIIVIHICLFKHVPETVCLFITGVHFPLLPEDLLLYQLEKGKRSRSGISCMGLHYIFSMIMIEHIFS